MGTAAKFNTPRGLSIDSKGNLYVIDSGNIKIRKVTPAGLVSTVQTPSPSVFLSIHNIAIDNSMGNLYVSDVEQNTGTHGIIRKVTLSTGAAQAPVSDINAAYLGAKGITVASDTKLYVANTKTHTIDEVTLANGTYTTLAGTAGTAGNADGTSTAAKFNYPAEIAINKDASILYVTDVSNHSIRKIVISTKKVTTLAGTGTAGHADGTGTAAKFNQPYGIAIDSAGMLYVTDKSNHVIRKINPADKKVTTIAGTAGTSGTANGTGTAAQFNEPYGIAIDSAGKLYVADKNNHRIRKIEFK